MTARQWGTQPGGASGALELVEFANITSAITEYTFTGLDGDNAFVYTLLCRLVNGAASTSSYYLEPNNTATNQDSVRHVFANDGTHLVNLAGAGMRFGIALAAQTYVVNLKFHALTGAPRLYVGNNSGYNNPASLETVCEQWVGRWNESVTNITSLDVRATVANGLGAGSYLALYRHKTS